MTRSPRYTSVAIALHWAIALGLLFMIWLGWNMDGKESWFQFHKSVGITILLLTVARIIWRLMNPPPALPADMKPLEKKASHFVHLGFYGLMLIMPLTGWLTVSTSYDFDIPTVLYGVVSWPDIPGVGFLSNELAHGIIANIHSKLAYVLFALLALHVAGAIKHEIGGEEGVLNRMLPGLFGKAGKPAAPPRGFIVAFGAAILLFLAIAYLPSLVSGKASPAPKGEATQGPQTENGRPAPNWTVDQAASSIAFTFTHEGKTYEGRFPDWAADIHFEEGALDDAWADVAVETATVETGKKLYTDSLRSGEWLGPSTYPEATVQLSSFRQDGDTYTADATLTLKDATVTVPFTFSLDITDNDAVMTGTATLKRKPLNLGQTSDPGADYVAETVTVDVRVEASRAN